MVKFGKWLEEKQNKYKKLMIRIHKMIVGAALAATEERKRLHDMTSTSGL